MKNWVRPMAVEDSFVPNASVSSCIQVACNTDAANAYEKQIHTFPGESILYNHRDSKCGDKTHQVIVTDENNNVVGMKEINGGSWVSSELNCTLYTDGSYKTKANMENLSSYVGKTIYWTSADKYLTWHHQGTLYNTDPNHPQRS